MRQLFGLVHRLEDEAIKASEFSDLSRAEISAIMAIGTGRPKTMTHVANILEINVSTLTTTINKLVKKGYVERLRDDKDRRIVKIGLSEKGIAAATERDSFMGELLRGAVEQVEPDKLRYFISAIDNINQYFMAKSSMSYLKTTPFALEPLQLGKRDLPVPIVQAGMSGHRRSEAGLRSGRRRRTGTDRRFGYRLAERGLRPGSHGSQCESFAGESGRSTEAKKETFRQRSDRRQRAVGKSCGA